MSRKNHCTAVAPVLAIILAMAVGTPVRAQLLVFDPSSYSQNLLTSETRRAAARPDLCRLVRGTQGPGSRALGRRGGPGTYDLCGLGRRQLRNPARGAPRQQRKLPQAIGTRSGGFSHEQAKDTQSIGGEIRRGRTRQDRTGRSLPGRGSYAPSRAPHRPGRSTMSRAC